MPRSYVPQIRVRQPRAPLGTIGHQAANPYRAHRANGLENGIANAAAALFRAPQERAAAEASRAQNAEALRYQRERDTKNDLFRDQEAAARHADAQESRKAQQAHWDAEDRRHAGAAAGVGKFSPFKREAYVNPDAPDKVSYRDVPRTDEEVHAGRRNVALFNGQPIDPADEVGQPSAVQIRDGVNPENQRPLGPENAYHLPMNPEIQQEDELFRQAQIEHGHGVAPAPAAGMFGDEPAAPAAADASGAPAMPPEIANFYEHVTGQAATPEDHAALDQIMPQMLTALSKTSPESQKSFRAMIANATADYHSGDPQRMAAAMQRTQQAAERLGFKIQRAPLSGPAPVTPAFSSPAGTAPVDLFSGGQ